MTDSKNAVSLPRAPYREGWLHKKKRKEGVFSNWDRRFFRIDSSACKLGYFHSKSEAEADKFPVDSISLMSITAVRVHEGTEFLIESSERNFTLQADNEKDALSWVNALEGYRRKLKSHAVASEAHKQQNQNKSETQKESFERRAHESLVSVAAAAAIGKGTAKKVESELTASRPTGSERREDKSPVAKPAVRGKGNLKRGSGLKTSPREASTKPGAKVDQSLPTTKEHAFQVKNEARNRTVNQGVQKKYKGENECKRRPKALIRGGGFKINHETDNEEVAMPIADVKDDSVRRTAWATPTKSQMRRGSGLQAEIISDVDSNNSERKGAVNSSDPNEDFQRNVGLAEDGAEGLVPPPPPPPLTEGTSQQNPREVYAALSSRDFSS